MNLLRSDQTTSEYAAQLIEIAKKQNNQRLFTADVWNAYFHFYSSRGMLEEMEKVIKTMQEHNVMVPQRIWENAAQAYYNNRKFDVAHGIFQDLASNTSLSRRAENMLLKIYCKESNLEAALRIHLHMRSKLRKCSTSTYELLIRQCIRAKEVILVDSLLKMMRFEKLSFQNLETYYEIINFYLAIPDREQVW